MADPRKTVCPDCGEETHSPNRRDFLKGVGAAAVAASANVLPLFATPRPALAAEPAKARPETITKLLYDSLKDEQRKVVCLPWDHAARTKISANWAITKPKVKDFFTADQQQMIRDIFRGCTSEEGYSRFLRQMDEDYGGFGSYHVALFGKPGEPFQWVMTGRHLTIRCDGDFSDGRAFGGPMVYGHGTGDSKKGLPGNVFYYQTLRANEVFAMLDGKQRGQALLPKAPREDAVQIRGASAELPGIAVGALSADQKKLVRGVMHDLLAPYRAEDVKEAMACLGAGGGLDKMHLAFYKDHDIGSDQVWDIWRLEGPTFVWHFRGAPHVHTYVNIANKGNG
jgi:hypothetical protein